MFEKLKGAFREWAADRIVGAILGSSVVTALVNALVGQFSEIPISWRVVLLVSLFTGAYAIFLKFMPESMSLMRSQMGVRRLDLAHRDAVAAVLQRYTPTLPVKAVSLWHYVSVADGLPLATELANLFQAAGWQVGGGNITGLVEHANGIWVRGPDAATRAIAVEVLKAAGLRSRIDDTDAESELQIIIGFDDADSPPSMWVASGQGSRFSSG
jgi:hypothetical protein